VNYITASQFVPREYLIQGTIYGRLGGKGQNG